MSRMKIGRKKRRRFRRFAPIRKKWKEGNTMPGTEMPTELTRIEDSKTKEMRTKAKEALRRLAVIHLGANNDYDAKQAMNALDLIR